MSNLEIVLLIALLLIFGGVAPIWSYSTAWGPYPGGIVLAVILVVLVVIMARRP